MAMKMFIRSRLDKLIRWPLMREMYGCESDNSVVLSNDTT